jgi:hypothetical protein
MVCGGPAAVSRPTRLSWHPPALYAVILFGLPGLILFLILVVVFRRRMSVIVPLCTRHRGYWLHRNLMTYGGMLGTFVMTCGALVLLLIIRGTFRNSAGDFCCIGNLAILAALWGAGAALEAKGMRVTEINAHSITFTGVSQDFINAVLRDRRGDISWEDDEEDR